MTPLVGVMSVRSFISSSYRVINSLMIGSSYKTTKEKRARALLQMRTTQQRLETRRCVDSGRFQESDGAETESFLATLVATTGAGPFRRSEGRTEARKSGAAVGCARAQKKEKKKKEMRKKKRKRGPGNGRWGTIKERCSSPLLEVHFFFFLFSPTVCRVFVSASNS